MFESRYINYSLISFRSIRAKYGANTNNIRRDNKSLLFLYYISGAAAEKDICKDEIQFLANASGSEDFGFSFTRNSWIQDLDPALHGVASLEIGILGYDIGDWRDQESGP